MEGGFNLKRIGIDDKISKQLLKDYEKLYRLAYSYVHNEADAMDIVQESAYRAIKNSSTLKEEKYIATWIYRITINTANEFVRKRKREVIGVEDYLADYEDTYTDIDVMDSLKTLNEQDRTIIVLRYFEDLKISDIAQIIGENENTIKSRLYRALKKLKVKLM